MKQIDSTKMSGIHIAQISHLQQSIWDLEKARNNIVFAYGNSDLGRCYVENIISLIVNLQEDIDNILDEYTGDEE